MLEVYLSSVGKRYRAEQKKFLEMFMARVGECRYRKIHSYRRGHKAWSCTKKKDPFSWECSPTSCPLVGNIVSTSLLGNEKVL